jgi:CubicO group peptidase (beta-lactamase class C family)
MGASLLPFPDQPDGVPWPTDEWEEADPPAEVVDGGLDDILDALVGPSADPALGHTNAVAVVHRGRLVVERYGEREMHELAELAGVAPGPITASDLLHSWSMAKSLCHLAVGVLVGRGLVDVNAPAPVPDWRGEGDARAAITWDNLLTMRAGLQWVEVYEGFDADSIPDVVTMLYGDGAADMAAYAAGFPLVHEPGSPKAYCYSSGTTNIVSRCLHRVLGVEGEAMSDFLHAAIFAPIGATSATFGYDASGTWVASSYANLTARDWVRVGLLALRGGRWDGTEVVPPGWLDHGRTPRSPDEELHHGAHWWARPERDDGMFMAHGFEGQRLMMCPARDLVVFRQGRTTSADKDKLNARLLALADLFP